MNWTRTRVLRHLADQDRFHDRRRWWFARVFYRFRWWWT